MRSSEGALQTPFGSIPERPLPSQTPEHAESQIAGSIFREALVRNDYHDVVIAVRIGFPSRGGAKQIDPVRVDKPATEPLGQTGASFGQARTIEMVFRAKLRRLEFETRQGKLIEAEAVRKTIADAVRSLRDGILGLPDRLATVLAAESDSKKVHVTLKSELSRELEALANAIGGI